MPEPEIICAGMVLVDVLVDGLAGLPAPGETGLVGGVRLATGGDAINQALALAKLGNRVGLMGLIGQDIQGRFIRERCAAHGVSTDGLFADPARGTATSVVLIDGGGERSFLSQRDSAIAAFGPEHVDLSLIRPGLKALCIGSLFTSARFDREALAPLLRRARAVGAITLADMVMDQQGYGLDGLAAVWPLLDYVVPSELEARIFTGRTDPQAIAEDFARRGVGATVLKRGAQGVMGFAGGQVAACPAFAVPVADTTGAGDTFVGGFVHALVQGMDLPAALRFGSACAALSVQAVGAGAGLRDLAQVRDFLSRQPLAA